MSKYSDSSGTYRTGQDSGGNYRQDHVEHGASHEHTWSKTSSEGQHKEGWHGKGAKTSGNRGRGSGK